MVIPKNPPIWYNKMLKAIAERKEKEWQTEQKRQSQRLEPLASSIGLLALVHTTRLTNDYDYQPLFSDNYQY